MSSVYSINRSRIVHQRYFAWTLWMTSTHNTVAIHMLMLIYRFGAHKLECERLELITVGVIGCQ